jgi:hypothetical protein
LFPSKGLPRGDGNIDGEEEESCGERGGDSGGEEGGGGGDDDAAAPAAAFAFEGVSFDGVVGGEEVEELSSAMKCEGEPCIDVVVVVVPYSTSHLSVPSATLATSSASTSLATHASLLLEASRNSKKKLSLGVPNESHGSPKPEQDTREDRAAAGDTEEEEEEEDEEEEDEDAENVGLLP